MLPVLLKIGPIQFYSYGFFLAIAVISAMSIIDAEAVRLGWDRKKLSRLVLIDFVVALIGSRLLFVLTQITNPQADLLSLFFNPHAGFVFYGGLIAAWAFVYWYVKREKWPLWSVIDAFSMALALGAAFGRVGCLLGGCCYGSATNLPWGIILKNEEGLGHVHPVQGYDAIWLFSLFFILWIFRKRKSFDGQLTILFLAGYALLRFISEYFRGDFIRGYVIDGFFTTSQFISIIMVGVAIGLYFKLRKNHV